MITLKYDVGIAIGMGICDHPFGVMEDLGYTKFVAFNGSTRYKVKYPDSIRFFEVTEIIEPLPPYLQIFDPVAEHPDRAVPPPIHLDNSIIHFHQDPKIFMTVNYGPRGSRPPELEQLEKERLRAEKSKRSAYRRK